MVTDARGPERTNRGRLALALLLVVPAALLAALASRDDGGPPPEQRRSPPSLVDGLGMEHVHGLGVDPADGSLLVATHFGLFRVVDGRASRIGNAQDTMGFTVAGPGRYLGSGHPDFTEDDEPLLGLIESVDAGQSWSPVSLRGEADFHVLRTRHDSVWGYDSTSGTVMVSRDGRTWDRRSRLTLRDFVVSPGTPNQLLATTEHGLMRSGTGGRSWKEVPGAPALVVLAWPRSDVLYGVDAEGVLHMSGDAGDTWASLGSTGGQPEALSATDAQPLNVHVAVRDRGIVASSDGGRTFTDAYVQR